MRSIRAEHGLLTRIISYEGLARMRSSSGFTLLEVMIVCAIIGLLSTIAIPSFMTSRKTSRKQVCAESQSLIGDMLDLYCLDNGKAPLVANFPNLGSVKNALVPLNRPDGYIRNRTVFECPANSASSQTDYDLVTSEGLVIGFDCNVVAEHN